MTKRRSDVPVFLLFAGIIHAIGLALLLPMLITLPGPEGESAPATESPSVDVIVLPPPQPLTDVGPEETSALPSASRGDEGNATGKAVPVAVEPEPGQEPRDDAVAPDAQDQTEAAPQETKPREAEPPEGEASQAEPLAAATPERDGAEAIPEPKSAVANITPAVEPQAETVPQPTEPSEAEPSATEGPETESRQAVSNAPRMERKDSAPEKLAPRTAKKPSTQQTRTAKPAPSRTASRTVKSRNKFAPFNMWSGPFGPPAKKRR